MHEFPRVRLLAEELKPRFTGEDIVPLIDGLGADDKLRGAAQRPIRLFDDQVPVHHLPGVEQVRRERLMPALGRLAVNVIVAKQPLHRRLHVAAAKSYADDVHVRLASRIAAPRERAMSEADFEAVTVE